MVCNTGLRRIFWNFRRRAIALFVFSVDICNAPESVAENPETSQGAFA